MWFSFFVTVLILTITFYQGLQGLFSALINCVLAIISAVVAFGYYEDVYFAWLVGSQPDNGRAIALVGIFVGTLVVLRVVFDLAITGNMHFPVYVDRVGGGVFGLITALILVGVLAIGFQLLDFNARFLGFTRYSLVYALNGKVVDVGSANEAASPSTDNAAAEGRTAFRQERHNLWFHPDGFTVALVSHLSDNALTGRNRFRTIYPDFLGSVYRAKAGMFFGEKRTVPPDSMSVEKYWYLDSRQGLMIPRGGASGSSGTTRASDLTRSSRPAAGARLLAVRVSLNQNAADFGNDFKFTAEQIRLVSRERAGGRSREFFLVGISPSPAVPGVLYEELTPSDLCERKASGNTLSMDLVFEVPEAEEFEPLFLEYKQNARVSLHEGLKQDRPVPPVGGSALLTAPRAGRPVSDPGSARVPPVADRDPGRTMPIKPARISQFSNALPFVSPLANYSSVVGQPRLTANALSGGRIFANLNDQWQPQPGTQTPIQLFDVPSNMRLLQLNVTRVRAGSMLGQVLNFARGAVRSFSVLDAGRTQYPAIGVYAMTMLDGRPVFEMIYLDETERIVGRLPELERIKESNLQDDDTYCFLFLVPPGTQITGMNVSNKHLDMSQDNLVAPN
ncbi:MAG: CvpA family protein [Phycisphaerales bacterium]|nr:CvpA family protein [Phycisphaerales bacterium]